ncbi:MAG: dihydropyrimidinase [Pseudomonadota bacterium]
MFDAIIRNGRVVTPDGVVNCDVGISGGKIASIGQLDQSAATQLIDATGKWLMPGGVDPHAHIEQMSGMGQMNADTFETATRSAAMGGTTSVISFAAQQRGERLADTMAQYAARAQRGAMIDHAFHMIVSDTSVPNFATDLADLISAGHRSIKIFTTYDIGLGDEDILEILALARQDGAIVCIHAENDTIIARARKDLIDAGHTLPRHHALSRPRVAEIEAVERMCYFAEYKDQPVMLFHISTKEAAEAVRRARTRGAPVWAETCPHYLFMTAEVLDQPDGAKWMCSPPQRGPEDQKALWQALSDGDLQIVSSDHAPYRYDETGKLSAGAEAGFHLIANGLPGLETRLPLLFDAMVSKGQLGPEKFVHLTATAPADLYGLATKGRIAPGMDADLVIWDPDRQTTYGDNDLNDNVGYNPWSGRTITGWPQTVLLRGCILVENGTFHGDPGQGRWLKRESLPKDMQRTLPMDRPTAPAQLAITFLYYRDLPVAMRFYEDVLGLSLAIDQGWCKIYRICEGAHVGLVDETRGMNKWAPVKPVQLCIRVHDVDAWYAYAKGLQLDALSELFQSEPLGIRAFVFNDPEGYQIEIQSATRSGA